MKQDKIRVVSDKRKLIKKEAIYEILSEENIQTVKHGWVWMNINAWMSMDYSMDEYK